MRRWGMWGPHLPPSFPEDSSTVVVGLGTLPLESLAFISPFLSICCPIRKQATLHGSAVPAPAQALCSPPPSPLGLILVLVCLQCSGNHRGICGKGSELLTEPCLPAGAESQPPAGCSSKPGKTERQPGVMGTPCCTLAAKPVGENSCPRSLPRLQDQ